MNLEEICQYMPFGLKGILTADYREDYWDCDWADLEEFKEGTIWQLAGYADSDLCIPLGEGEFAGLLWRNESTYTCFHGKGIKPLMHSLSDLTRLIEHNGEKFVPIVRLYGLAVEDSELMTMQSNMKFISDNERTSLAYSITKDFSAGYQFNYLYKEQYFSLVHSITNTNEVINQLQLFQKLHEWHFWLGDQSRFGQDIIDINTLNE